MKKEITIAKALKNFYDGKYDVNDRATQCKAGWYDWFCKEDLLGAKTGKLYNKLALIADSKKFDKNQTYVFFKQISSSKGLLDSFSICDLKSGKVLYNIALGKTGVATEVYGIDNDFNEALVCGSWVDVKKFFIKNKENQNEQAS